MGEAIVNTPIVPEVAVGATTALPLGIAKAAFPLLPTWTSDMPLTGPFLLPKLVGFSAVWSGGLDLELPFLDKELATFTEGMTAGGSLDVSLPFVG